MLVIGLPGDKNVNMDAKKSSETFRYNQKYSGMHTDSNFYPLTGRSPLPLEMVNIVLLNYVCWCDEWCGIGRSYFDHSEHFFEGWVSEKRQQNQTCGPLFSAFPVISSSKRFVVTPGVLEPAIVAICFPVAATYWHICGWTLTWTHWNQITWSPFPEAKMCTYIFWNTS